MGIKKVVFIAVKHGIVEFITEIMKYYPDIIWCYDDYNRHIFSYATLQRQEKIFNLIYTMGAKKNSVQLIGTKPTTIFYIKLHF